MIANEGARADVRKRAYECMACANDTAADELAALRAAVAELVDEWERSAERVRDLLGPDPDDYSASVASSLGDIDAARGCAAELRALLDGAIP